MNDVDSKPIVGRDWIAFVGSWIPYSFLTYRFWYNNDDAFISFRYAKNWAMGHGLRYNLGSQPPEEGYSNFLWVLVCALAEYLQLDVTFWAPMLGFACGSLLLYLVFRTLRQDFGMALGVAFPITLGLGLFPPFALWSTGGMATMAFALSAFATAYFLVLRSGGIAPYRGALAGVAMALLRIEGIAWVLLLALLGVITRRMRGETVWRPMAVYVAIVGSAFSIYFAWRYSYYQLLFPNPVSAKVGLGFAVFLRGFRYVGTFALTFLTPFLLVPAGYVAVRDAPKRLAFALGTLSLAFPAYAVAVGGDWMPMGRFLIPGLAFCALMMGWLVTRLWERRPSRLAFTAVVTVTLAVGLLPAWNLQLVPTFARRVFHFRYYGAGFRTEYGVWKDGLDNLVGRKEVALALRARFKPRDSVIGGAIGVLGYYSELHIYDRYGLVDRRVATRPQQQHKRLRSPGHDSKVPTSFFFSDKPTVLLHERLDGPPPDRKNPEYPLERRVRTKAEAWRTVSVWRRYVPEILPLEPLPEGSPSVLMVLRSIEEGPQPGIATLPRPERRAAREKRAEKAWDDFFTGLDSALP